MTIEEAVRKALENDSDVPELLAKWNEVRENRLLLAEFLVQSLEKNGGKLKFADVAFIFILGVQTGIILEHDKQQEN